jgi:hypothetical protein
MPSKFDVALICLNGHLINSNFNANPELNSKFCSECGTEAINLCPNCQTQIKGQIIDDLPYPQDEIKVPNFCEKCSKPYPWTVSKQEQEKKDKARKSPGNRLL